MFDIWRNKIRESFGFRGTPLKFIIRGTKREGAVKSYGYGSYAFLIGYAFGLSDLIYLWKDEGN